MNLTRRGFMKATGAAFATSMAFQLTQQSPALAVESNSTPTSAAIAQADAVRFFRCAMAS